MISLVNVDVPVGAVIAFAGSVSTTEAGAALQARGWLLCDGRALATNLYPELFEVLGALYGGTEGVFNVPAIPAQRFGAGEVTYIIKAVQAAPAIRT